MTNIKMTNMKKLILILLFSIGILWSQCVGTQSFTMTPVAPPGGYLPGTTVQICYTMNGWNFVGSNWVEGFDINLGPGWTNLTPLAPPANCGGGGGNWIWMNSVTSSNTGITVGPGWFFEIGQGGPVDGNPGNDWGDFGQCIWSFCFNITTSNNCNPTNLLVQVTVGADGTWGSWGSNSCPTTPFTIYNGMSANVPALTSPITHN
jgi:hypothetical protein